jgi:hypothetical protein
MRNEHDLDAIDDLPKPERGRLALETILAVCKRGAMSAKRVNPEQALDKLEAHTRGMLPTDPTTQSLDGWTRFGAVAGANAAWTKTKYCPPKDAPSMDHALLHGAAFFFAFGVVDGVIHGR